MVPIELTRYNQWVLWREVIRPEDGTRTKIPYTISGNLASVADPRTWTTYDNAVQAAQRLVMGIGFVLTDDDPYAFIDLDNPGDDPALIERHNKIIGAFDSYTEVSPSGTGMHIIIRGNVEKGRRRNKVECYSNERYMTITGNTYLDKPIQDRSYLFHQLWTEIGPTNGNGNHTYAEEKAEEHTDEEIYRTAVNAENGEKFSKLWQGHWLEAGYTSQSEADFALINILSFYSRNVTQIRRLFFLSGLGKRDKAKRKDYIETMIKRSFDNAPVYVPLEALTSNLLERLQADSKLKATNPFAGPLFAGTAIDDWTMPPGILGDIADFIYKSSPRPVKEIALGGAIALMAGICGRAYNISGTGLNQYILILAGTGRGKDAIDAGISKIMRYVQLKVPAAPQFIGPTEIASGQALIKYIGTNPCFVSIVGEFGLALQAMCDYRANGSQLMLRKKLLELYTKSGEKAMMQPTIYSDKDKNTKIVNSPAFSLLGESNPESYYGGLDETMIAQGLLPRFLGIEYSGNRVPLNEGHQNVEPSNSLVESVADLAANCLTMAANTRVIHVKMNTEAELFAREFETITTANINNSKEVIAQELWSRAHLKMLKLAALIAVGINMYDPTIDLACLQWAKQLVERDVNNVFARFEEGKIGRATSETHQIAEVSSVIKEYLFRPFDGTFQKYLVDPQMHQDKVISMGYLHRRVAQKAAFRNDRMGVTNALKRVVDSLVADGAIQEVRQIDLSKRYTRTMKAYAVTDITRFTS